MRESPRCAREKVVYQGEAAKRSHKALFSLDDACYVPVSKDIVGTVLACEDKDLDRLHISAGLRAILKVALWTRGDPAMYDVINLLKKAGATDHELGPFRGAAVEHILPSLYYGRRFDILKRVCRAAKATAESRINTKVYCHLVSEQDAKIVASSL